MHGGRTMKEYSEAFVAFDTAKKKHAVAIADVGREGEIRYLGEIDSSALTMCEDHSPDRSATALVLRSAVEGVHPITVIFLALNQGVDPVRSFRGPFHGFQLYPNCILLSSSAMALIATRSGPTAGPEVDKLSIRRGAPGSKCLPPSVVVAGWKRCEGTTTVPRGVTKCRRFCM